MVPHALGECTADPVVLLYRPKRSRSAHRVKSRGLCSVLAEIPDLKVLAVKHTLDEVFRHGKHLPVTTERVISMHTDPVDAHLDHPVALKGFKETVQVAVNGCVT